MEDKYEGTAIDMETFNSIQPVEDAPQTQNAEGVDPQDGGTPATVDKGSTEPVKFSVEGVGEFTADEIKELKQSGLRQSDYTKKTQELARQREEAKDALELMNYLRQNPHIVDAMKEVEGNVNMGILNKPTVENQMLMEIAFNQKSMELDMKVNQLKEKYGDVDEVALFDKAKELQTEDLEFVYKALRYDESANDRQKLIEEAKAQLKAELEANKSGVSTVVDITPSGPVALAPTLDEDQKRIARGMGLTEEEYLKWMK